MKKKIVNFILLGLVSSPSWVSIAVADNDYTAKGFRVGSFTIKPTLELTGAWSSNIYRKQTQPVAGFITYIKPSLAITSNWNNHSVDFSLSHNMRNYIDHPNENRQIMNVNLNGRLDVLRNSFAFASVDYLNQPDERDSPDVPTNTVKPVGHQMLRGQLGYDHQIHRIRVNASHLITQDTYSNSVTNVGRVIENNQNRNRTTHLSTLRVGYEIRPSYEAFIKGSYNVIDYNSKYQQNNTEGLGPASIQRSSKGYSVIAGLELELTGKLTGNARIGYQSQNYESPRLNTISGLAGGMTVKWTPTGLTTISSDLSRTIKQTTQEGSSGYLATAFITKVEHELRRNVILSINAGYTYNEYIGGNFPNPPRTDSIYLLGGGAKYLLNRYLFVNASYLYNTRQVQNVANANYDVNMFYIGIGSQL